MKKDILNRAPYVEQLIEIIECIENKKSSYCFAIDGKWGVGKSYVLEMLETKLNEIPSKGATDNKYFVFHYNCWKYDYYEEASIAIIAAMLDRIEEEERLFEGKTEEFMKSSWHMAKETLAKIAGEFSKNKIGIDIVETIGDINKITEERNEEKYKFDNLYAFRKTLDDARRKLKELAETKAIILVVDELDRCLPEYAIKVMERLHHLFEGIDNITVILSVDSKQLEHSIKHIYGDNVDVEKYLKKFIDFSLLLDEGQISENFMKKYSDYFDCFRPVEESEQKMFVEMFEKIFSGIGIRDQEKIITKAKLIHEIVQEENMYDICLLAFEMIYSLIVHKTKTSNISNIMNTYITPPVSLATSTVTNMLGDVMANYFLSEKIFFSGNYHEIMGHAGGRFYDVTNHFLGKTYWLLKAINETIKGNTCRDIYLEESLQPKKEVEIAKKFAQMFQIM